MALKSSSTDQSSVNSGICVLNYAPPPDAFTVVAFGMGRSGTTMIARILQGLGLNMGDHLTPMSCEDKPLQVAIKRRDPVSFSKYCEKRNSESNVWAFKVPAFRGCAAEYCGYLRNPRMIVVFRDILAISLRNQLSLCLDDAAHLLLKSAAANLKLAEEVKRLECPVMLVSYEKALQFPDELVRAIAEYCAISLTDEEVQSVSRKNICNADPRYLFQSQ